MAQKFAVRVVFPVDTNVNYKITVLVSTKCKSKN